MLLFRIDARRNSPKIVIDKQKHLIEITGNSTFKNTSWFYSNVLKWAVAFNLKEPKSAVINIRLTRMNSDSEKWISLITRKIANIVPNNNVIVNWYYNPTNSNMQLNGERLKLNSLVKINLIAA